MGRQPSHNYYIHFDYMQKRVGGGGVQIACKIAYIIDGGPPMASDLCWGVRNNVTKTQP